MDSPSPGPMSGGAGGVGGQHLLGNGSIVAGRWEIVRPIARGGMGSVFEARHTLSKKTVALKVLDLASAHNERHLVRFQREVSIRAEVGHDGIVDVLDAGIDPATGRPFVAMEMLSGEDMRDRMDRPGSPREPLYRAVRQMLDPLAAAHAHGVVHRDLKPENVYLAKQPDGSERVKLLDFGIAVHREGQRATMTGIPMGTPNYMSPEQTLDAASVNDRADSWSVGVMLFELASGRTPYVGSTPQEVFALTISSPAPALLSVAPKAPPRLAALVDRCLQREAALRPDVQTIARELDVIFPPMVVAAPKPKRSSTSSILFGCLVLGLLGLLVGGGGAAYVVVVRAEAARRREAAAAAEARAAAAQAVANQYDLSMTGARRRSAGAAAAAPPALTPAQAVARLGPSRLPVPVDAPFTATPDGPLLIQIVTEFQCPGCPRWVPAIANRLERQYPHAIRFAMRQYPLPMHARAFPAAEAALEVRAQGGDTAYWRFYDVMLGHAQSEIAADRTEWDLSDAKLVQLASSVQGIDPTRIRAALADHRHVPRIRSDMEQLDAFAGGTQYAYGQRYGVPTFVIHDTICWPTNQLDLFRAVEQALAGRRPDPCTYQ